MSPAPPDHRPADDLWRIVAAVGVVAIHAAGGFEAGWPDDPSTWLAVPVSQWARFSVPLFLVFSGYGLGKSDVKRGVERFDGREYRRFWRRRGVRILAPFAAFTLAGLWWNGRLSPAALADAALRGTGDYHLYFLSFLVQGYLLWPLLRRASWPAIAALFAIQLVFSSPTHLLWPERPHIPAWLIVHWAGYMALGARLARTTSPGPAGALPAAAIALAAVIAEYTAWAARLDSPGHYNHFCRWVVIAYALATVWLWRRSAASVTARIGRRADAVARWAGLTFTVYLIHPWVLRLMAKTPLDWPFAPRWLVATAGAFALAAALDRAVRARLLRTPLGLG